jgi:hypothetical protein
MESIIQQKPHRFQLERTDDEITSHAGLTMISEAYKILGIKDLVRKMLPRPGSNRGIAPEVYIESLILLQCGGGSRLEDIRQIEVDKALRKLIGMRHVPSSDALGDWLRRTGGEKKTSAGMMGLGTVNIAMAQTTIRQDVRTEFTLDIDATPIESAKKEAQMTYLGFRGYMPILGYIAENDVCLYDDFREGNASPQDGIADILRHCKRRMPEEKRISRLRSDSAGYQAAVINECEREEDRVIYTITADLDCAVKGIIATIPEKQWKPFLDRDDEKTKYEITETIHSMEDTKKAFRLVVKRKRNEQMSLFDQQEYRYYGVVTNGEESPEEVMWFHNAKGNSENYHKELKSGFGMEYLPCGQFNANAFFFRIGVLTYNLIIALKRLFLPQEWWRKTIASLRWQLIQIAGKVVRHSRRLILKVSNIPDDIFTMWQGVRQQFLFFSG